MSRNIFFPVLILSTGLLSACGGGTKEDKQTTETRMDDIDSLEGTISDDMINTDEATEEGPFEPAPAIDPTAHAKNKAGDDKANEEPTPETDDKAKAE